MLKNKKEQRLAVFTADMLEDAQKGKVRIRVGVSEQAQGSRRQIKGQTDRKPTLRGASSSYFGRGA